MKIRIDGGVVVGCSGSSHELVLQGSVLIDGDTITSVGTDKSQPADKIIDAAGKIVSPGFVNLHVHSQLNIGDYLLAGRPQEGLLGRQLVCLWRAVERKSGDASAARGGDREKVCALQRA